MRKKHITFEEYNNKMKDLMESEEFKELTIEEQLIALLELSSDCKIKKID